MKINKITVEKLNGKYDLDIDLSTPDSTSLCILTGNSGSGKSLILTAVEAIVRWTQSTLDQFCWRDVVNKVKIFYDDNSKAYAEFVPNESWFNNPPGRYQLCREFTSRHNTPAIYSSYNRVIDRNKIKRQKMTGISVVDNPGLIPESLIKDFNHILDVCDFKLHIQPDGHITAGERTVDYQTIQTLSGSEFEIIHILDMLSVCYNTTSDSMLVLYDDFGLHMTEFTSSIVLDFIMRELNKNLKHCQCILTSTGKYYIDNVRNLYQIRKQISE